MALPRLEGLGIIYSATNVFVSVTISDIWFNPFFLLGETDLMEKLKSYKIRS